MLHLRTHLLSPKASSVGSDEFQQPKYTVRFLILGIAHLFFWNALLNSLHDLNGPHIYVSVITTATILYNVSTIVGFLLVLITGVQLSRPAFYIASVCMGLSNLAIPVLYSLFEPSRQLALLYILVSFGGLSSAIFQSCGFGIAASMPDVLSGWVSWGNGASGLISGAIWILSPFSSITRASILFISGGVMCLLSLAGMIDLLRVPTIKLRLDEHVRRLEEVRNNPAMPSYPELFRRTWDVCTATFLIFFISLLVFPAVVPFALKYASNQEMDILIVLFQAGDFLGRWSLVWFEEKLMISSGMLLTLSLLRTMFIFPISLLTRSRALEIPILFMLALSLSNGWLASCALMRGPLTLRSFRLLPCRHKIASLQLLLLMCGVCSGLLLSPLLVPKARMSLT